MASRNKHRCLIAMIVCTICNQFASSSYAAVLRHMGSHRFDPALSIKCGINECSECYKNFESFRSHIYRKHRDILTNEIQPVTVPILECELECSANEDDYATNEECSNSFVEMNTKKVSAKFLLKTLEERKVTQCALSGIIEDIHGLWRDNLERIKVNVTICIHVSLFCF